MPSPERHSISVSDGYGPSVSILTSGWLPVGPSVVQLPSPFVPSPPPKRHNLSISILTSVCFLLSNPLCHRHTWDSKAESKKYNSSVSILTSECENLEIQRCIPDASLANTTSNLDPKVSPLPPGPYLEADVAIIKIGSP